MSANDRQVGGNHYASNLQHWDVCENYGIGYLESAATKYVTRWRSKGGLQDLEKALHYTEKLMEIATIDPTGQRPRRFPRGYVPHEVLRRFVVANSVGPREYTILAYLFTWKQVRDLEEAKAQLEFLIRIAKNDSTATVRTNHNVAAPVDGEPAGLDLGASCGCGCGDEGHSSS